MTGKRYLKWYNKVGYGSGDIAGNVVYAFLSSFVTVSYTHLLLLYSTDIALYGSDLSTHT